MDVVVDVLSRITDETLDAGFGRSTLARARQYAADESVRTAEVMTSSTSGVQLRGWVQGSGARTYEVRVSVEDWDGVADVESHCTCPVQWQCKHAAAVVLVLRARSAPTESSAGTEPWERELTGLLSALEPPPVGPSTYKPVAIQASAAAQTSWSHSGHPEGPWIALRLLQRGARGRWVQGGIRWSDVPLLGDRRVHDPAAVSALERLHVAMGRGRYYGTAIDLSGLDEFGPHLAPLLHDAVEAGVVLVAGPGLESFRVLAEPVDVGADVATDDDTGTTLVRLAVDHDGEQWFGARIRPVGQPVHSVGLLRGTAPLLDLVLAPLRQPLPAAGLRVLRAEEPLVVPSAGRSRLVESFLPQLARHVVISSEDGSVTIPEPLVRSWS